MDAVLVESLRHRIRQAQYLSLQRFAEHDGLRNGLLCDVLQCIRYHEVEPERSLCKPLTVLGSSLLKTAHGTECCKS